MQKACRSFRHACRAPSMRHPPRERCQTTAIIGIKNLGLVNPVPKGYSPLRLIQEYAKVELMTTTVTAGGDCSSGEAAALPVVPFGEAVWTWCRVAALSFGGPAGQIAVMHRIIVDEKKWVDEARFLHALNYCMLLPGPEAQQLATYIGWLLHGVRGGLAAGLLFIAPGAIAILILSVIYAQYQETLLITAVFFGLKPAVTAIVMEAVLRIGKRVLKNRSMVVLATLSFVALAAFAVPFPVVILVAGLIGFIGSRVRPEEFVVLKGHGSATTTPSAPAPAAVAPARLWRRGLIVSAICLPLWFAPVIILAALLGPDSIFVTEGVFFSKMAVVTFGGAYAVLAYVAQQGVEHFHWLEPGEMLDGLGMAETTPGPLIMVLQFVGFMAAYRNPGPIDPLIAGVLGSLVTTWVTFVPCFYWIFLGAPFVERLRGHRGLTGALSAITAAVVGVISNLWLWFLIHTLFATVQPVTWGPLHVQIPELSSFNLPATAIAVLALLLTFRWKLGMVWTLSISTLAGVAWMLAQKLL